MDCPATLPISGVHRARQNPNLTLWEALRIVCHRVKIDSKALGSMKMKFNFIFERFARISGSARVPALSKFGRQFGYPIHVSPVCFVPKFGHASKIFQEKP